jgi:hypothetical protein
VQVAVNPKLDPTNWTGLVGVTAMLESVGGRAWQVSVVFPLIAPMAAVITEGPAAIHVATSGSTTGDAKVACEGVPEVHTDKSVTSLVDPSEYVPVAMKPTVEPTLTVGLVGVTAILLKVGGGGPTARHVRVELPDTVPMAAVITEVPGMMQLTGCGSALAPMVATDGLPLVHVA